MTWWTRRPSSLDHARMLTVCAAAASDIEEKEEAVNITQLSRMMKITFVGTGVSCAIPVIGHFRSGCACADALSDSNSPNRRNNVSLLISLPKTVGPPPEAGVQAATEQWHHILIDCGKTFRSAYLRVLAPLAVRAVDALLITHGHADAMHCVEELCNMHTESYNFLQAVRSAVHENDEVAAVARQPLQADISRRLLRVPTYLTQPTLDQIDMISSKLVQASKYRVAAPANREEYEKAQMNQVASITSISASLHDETCSATAAMSSTSTMVTRDAPKTKLPLAEAVMDIHFLDEKKPSRIYIPIGHATGDDLPGATAPDLPFYAVPVEHGENYISMGFVFGQGVAFKSQRSGGEPPAQDCVGSCIVYISDVSAIPEVSMRFLEDLVKIDVLVVDCLAGWEAASPTHFCLAEAWPVVEKLAPRTTYFVGMFCSLEHKATNQLLSHYLVERKKAMRAAMAVAASTEMETLPERSQNKKFLELVQSVELAYDGQQLDIPI